MKDFLRHIFTGKDNATIDIARVLLASGVLSFIGFAGWHVVGNHAFDPMAYGTGFGALLGGGCAGIGLKGKTEPGA
jgi:hypothetical protein